MRFFLTFYLLFILFSFLMAGPIMGAGECCNCGGLVGCGIPDANCPTAGESCQVDTSGTCSSGQRCTPGSPSTPTFRIPGYDRIGFPDFKFKGYSIASLGLIVSALLPYVYVVAGLLLFAYLLYGGFHLVTSFGSPKAILEAWTIIFRALVGFIMVFVSFWLIQIVERVFGLNIV